MAFRDTIHDTLRNSSRHFPAKTDPRIHDGAIFPSKKVKFRFPFDSRTIIFPIGSCFAREIEMALAKTGVVLPTLDFAVPATEWPHPNGLINEYNPATFYQRITHALQQTPYSTETIVAVGDLYADLLLQGGCDVTFARAVERRAEIDKVYQRLANAHIVIITLGFIEAWFDTTTGLYLNRMPPVPHGMKFSDRYRFERIEPAKCISLIRAAVEALGLRGIKIILTVSPVPIHMTFAGRDCVTANEYSKSVLRVCAEVISSDYDFVDYFPSYEIVRSMGMAGYIDDNVHVTESAVAQIMRYMTMLYSDAEASIPG